MKEDLYYAKVVPTGVKTIEDIIQDVKGYHSTVTEADTKAVIPIVFSVIRDYLVQGYSINLPIASFRPTITGSFNSLTDSFDRKRHTVGVSISAGSMLNKALSGVPIEKVDSTIPSPHLMQLTDCNSKQVNNKVTPNLLAKLIGSELKFESANEKEGLYFISRENSEETKVTVFASVSQNKIIFNVPALKPGSYSLQLRKGYGKSNMIRSGMLNDLITIV